MGLDFNSEGSHFINSFVLDFLIVTLLTFSGGLDLIMWSLEFKRCISQGSLHTHNSGSDA